MNTFNPPAGRHPAPTPRAGSLRRTAVSHLQAFWEGLERMGQRRAARELLMTADRIQASRPELAAQLRAMVRENHSL